jgi:type II secretory pathway pseudopilin PulG
MLKKQSAKRSFTLVEVIVVLALVSIVGTMIVSMLVPASNVFRVLSTRIEVKMKADQVMKTLVSQVRFSRELEISDDEALLLLDPEKRKLYSQDGKVYLYDDSKTKDLYNDDFYNGFSVELWTTKLEDNLIEISCTATLISDENISYTLTTAIECYNTQIIAGNEGNILSYDWQE